MAFIKIVNAELGSDARYDVNAATPEERMQLDGEGRPLSDNLPDQWTWTDGLPGARGGGAPGGGGGGGGGSSNPYYQQYQASIQAAQAADMADTKSQLQQLLIQFGLVPEGFQDKMGALDETIRQLIAKNTESGISQYARLLEGKGDAQRETLGQLGSKGLLRSGARGKALRKGDLNFERTFADSIAAVMGNANSLQSGYAGREMGRQNSLAQYLAQIMGSMRSFGGGGGGLRPSQYTPEPPPVFQSAAGPSPYQPTSTGGAGGNQPGYYQGGALFATPEQNKDINPIFWFK
jgi:hypothetical protein